MNPIEEIACLITEDPDLMEDVTSLDYILHQIKVHIIEGAKDRKKTKKEEKFAEIFKKGGTMYHVLYAIHHEKCINDLGSTYIKGLIGRAIKVLFPNAVNSVRERLGLEKVDSSSGKSLAKSGYRMARQQHRVATGKAT